MTVTVIDVDGTRTPHEIDPADLFPAIERLLQATATGLFRVKVPPCQSLLVDRAGRGLINLHASRLAHRSVRGPAVLVDERQFERES